MNLFAMQKVQQRNPHFLCSFVTNEHCPNVPVCSRSKTNEIDTLPIILASPYDEIIGDGNDPTDVDITDVGKNQDVLEFQQYSLYNNEPTAITPIITCPARLRVCLNNDNGSTKDFVTQSLRSEAEVLNVSVPTSGVIEPYSLNALKNGRRFISNDEEFRKIAYHNVCKENCDPPRTDDIIMSTLDNYSVELEDNKENILCDTSFETTKGNTTPPCKIATLQGAIQHQNTQQLIGPALCAERVASELPNGQYDFPKLQYSSTKGEYRVRFTLNGKRRERSFSTKLRGQHYARAAAIELLALIKQRCPSGSYSELLYEEENIDCVESQPQLKPCTTSEDIIMGRKTMINKSHNGFIEKLKSRAEKSKKGSIRDTDITESIDLKSQRQHAKNNNSDYEKKHVSTPHHIEYNDKLNIKIKTNVGVPLNRKNNVVDYNNNSFKQTSKNIQYNKCLLKHGVDKDCCLGSEANNGTTTTTTQATTASESTSPSTANSIKSLSPSNNKTLVVAVGTINHHRKRPRVETVVARTTPLLSRYTMKTSSAILDDAKIGTDLIKKTKMALLTHKDLYGAFKELQRIIERLKFLETVFQRNDVFEVASNDAIIKKIGRRNETRIDYNPFSRRKEFEMGPPSDGYNRPLNNIPISELQLIRRVASIVVPNSSKKQPHMLSPSSSISETRPPLLTFDHIGPSWIVHLPYFDWITSETHYSQYSIPIFDLSSETVSQAFCSGLLYYLEAQRYNKLVASYLRREGGWSIDKKQCHLS